MTISVAMPFRPPVMQPIDRSSCEMTLSHDANQDAAFAHEPLFELSRVTPAMTGAH
jgi:hypothetical protein